MQQARKQGRDRQEIETVVFQHRRQHAAVAGPDKSKIAARDFESRHVVRPRDRADAMFESGERTARPESRESGGLTPGSDPGVRPRRPRRPRRRPEAPCRMQHVDVGDAAPNPVEAVELEPRLE